MTYLMKPSLIFCHQKQNNALNTLSCRLLKSVVGRIYAVVAIRSNPTTDDGIPRACLRDVSLKHSCGKDQVMWWVYAKSLLLKGMPGEGLENGQWRTRSQKLVQTEMW